MGCPCLVFKMTPTNSGTAFVLKDEEGTNPGKAADEEIDQDGELHKPTGAINPDAHDDGFLSQRSWGAQSPQD
jgi:hypothetical protein